MIDDNNTISSLLFPGSHPKRCYISGPKGCGKSSLVFGLAYDLVAKGEYPLIICNKAKLEGNFPLPVVNNCLQRSNEKAEFEPNYDSHSYLMGCMTSIELYYVKDSEELNLLLSSLHLFKRLPTVIIIEGIK